MTEQEKKEMLEQFLEGIKHKSVYSTLKNVISGKKTNVFYQLKGLSSLFTHLCIELEKDNEGYRDLLFDVHDKINRIMKNM